MNPTHCILRICGGWRGWRDDVQVHFHAFCSYPQNMGKHYRHSTLHTKLCSSLSHICHSSIIWTHKTTLSHPSPVVAQPSTTTHVSLYKKLLPLYLWQKILCCLLPIRQLYQPCHRCLLLGSHCTHYQWQVFLPVNMCCVGGRHLNTVSSTILDSTYFYFKGVFQEHVFYHPLAKSWHSLAECIVRRTMHGVLSQDVLESWLLLPAFICSDDI